MYGRSPKRATLDFSQTADVDTTIYQLVVSSTKSFDTLTLVGLDDKPFATRMQQWLKPVQGADT
ncbi:MAG TPA: hypothetical protein ENI62_09490 [Gammaproteobacteria bacterium]|nr:hypothetical protein [Gammaproteobacteria bacterium]